MTYGIDSLVLKYLCKYFSPQETDYESIRMGKSKVVFVSINKINFIISIKVQCDFLQSALQPIGC